MPESIESDGFDVRKAKTMEADSKLTQLVDRAACCLTMLDPADASDAQELQDVFRQIRATLAALGGDQGALTQECQGTSAQAVEVLERILRKDVEDTSEALDVVSKAICGLQDLTRQLLDRDVVGEPTSAKSPGPGPAGQDAAAAQPTGAFETPEGQASSAPERVIPEEDAPLVLDFIAEAGEHIETAESTLSYFPPSLKESGVQLRIPITTGSPARSDRISLSPSGRGSG